ncbi:TPA: replication endonuclease [Morganella morganii]|nr:replication endonuclease [Morganella morganii]
MTGKIIDFSVQPPPEPAVFVHEWNKKRHEAVLGFEQPLTPAQLKQNQDLQDKIERLPRMLRFPFRKRYESIYEEKGLLEAHKYLYFKFYREILPRVNAVNDRFSVRHMDQFNALPELSDKAVKLLAKQLAKVFFERCQLLIDKVSEIGDGAIFKFKYLYEIYGHMAVDAKELHITPLHYSRYLKGSISEKNIHSALARLVNDDFWYRRLRAHRARWRESLLIAVMAVNMNKRPYASRQAINEVRAQRKANEEYLKQMDIEDTETGERFDLFEKVMGSISNPEIRRMELMAQIAGIERVAMQRGDIGMFVTITTPSKYHPTKVTGKKDEKKAIINHNWSKEAYTPKNGQTYLVRVWSKIRTAFKDYGLKVYGIRVVEPHHDGTPHWHLLLFTDKASRTQVIDIMRKKALAVDGKEQGAQKHRFKCEHMNRGGAVSYIAKYISKNIDGYALDGEIDNDTGKPLSDTAAAVTAWAATWRIPQFQFYNLPSKGAYRECRKLRGISIAEQIGDVAEKVRFAADKGFFDEYILSQGGPCTPRDLQTVRVARRAADRLNQYDEEVPEVFGIYSPVFGGDVVKTRERKYQIVKKHDSQNPAPAAVGFDFNLLKGGIADPRSPVNNCGSVISADGDKSPDLAPNYGMTGVHQINQWGSCLSNKAAEKAAQAAVPAQTASRVNSRITLSDKEIAFIPEIQKFTAAMGHEMPADGLMMMFIRGMTVDYGDQKLLFRDGRMRLELGDETKAVKERQQAVKREKKVASILARVEKMRKG